MKINSNFLKLIDYIFLMVFNLYITQNIYISFIFSTSIYLGIYAFRTYDFENIESWNDTIIRVFAGTMLGFLVISTFYVIFDGYILKEYFLDNFVFNIIALPIIHKISYYILLKNITPKKYIVIGKKEEWHKLMNEIEKKSLGKLQFVEYINPSPVKLKKLIKVYDGVLIADPELEKLVIDEINEFKENGVKVEYLPVIVERFLKRIPIQVAEKFKSHYEVAFSEIKESPAKRIVDIFISLIALIILSPVFLLISIAIFIENGKPIIFKQKRIGKDEKEFILIKFRSMYNNKNKTEKFADEEKDRIMKSGKIIRPIRLDEIPQFINILKGEMSFVGPRPEQPGFVKQFNELIPFYEFRHKVKPGLTGWAQINYKYPTTLEETKIKTSYDLYYVKNRTTLLDLKIIMQTIEAILWKKGI
ncbi:sugar transferase [Marinitoga sp. 1155]|uniref:sugar transferase n=1 Tax=Marinitoga sp. 1155 TaxID=1428448 RepID=UPI000659ED97|nr:sugar transferase [Marinitoga sp. 1155]KLO21181.1 polyprenyl glycosylphosphotransferase [Marinitoga sp. 1155]